MPRGVFFSHNNTPTAVTGGFLYANGGVRRITGGWFNLGQGMKQFWPGYGGYSDRNLQYDGDIELIKDGGIAVEYTIDDVVYNCYRITGDGELKLKKTGSKVWLCGGGSGGNCSGYYNDSADVANRNAGSGGSGGEANITESLVVGTPYAIHIGSGGKGSTSLSDNASADNDYGTGYKTLHAGSNVPGGNTTISSNGTAVVTAHGGYQRLVYNYLGQNVYTVYGNMGGGGGSTVRYSNIGLVALLNPAPRPYLIQPNSGDSIAIYPYNYYGNGIHTDYKYGLPYNLSEFDYHCAGGGGGAGAFIMTTSTRPPYSFVIRGYYDGGSGIANGGRAMTEANDGGTATGISNENATSPFELSVHSGDPSEEYGGIANLVFADGDADVTLSNITGTNPVYGCGGVGGSVALMFGMNGTVTKKYTQNGGDGTQGVVYIFMPTE